MEGRGLDDRALQANWARLLLSSLVAAGVEDVVLSPGSRSTPFVLAAIREPKLTCYDVADERSAAFFALGQARITGRPTLLLCTSGTAGANYYPAVVEAGANGVPLLVLTADRPLDLQGCGANQTIDQIKLFGGHVRRFIELGEARGGERELRALRRTASQAFLATLHPEPGPVHLNARARKPLEPETEESRGGETEKPLHTTVPVAFRPRLLPPVSVLDQLAAACQRSERGLLVAGPAPASQAGLREVFSEVARRAGFVVLTDAASQLRWGLHSSGAKRSDATVTTYSTLLANADFRASHAPDLIVQIGRAPTTTIWERYIAEHAVGAGVGTGGAEHWLIAPQGWHDPQSTADYLVAADASETLTALLERLPPSSSPTSETEWTRSWTKADALVRGIQDSILGQEEGLSEAATAQAVVSALPSDGVLVVGNSLPIREVDAWVAGPPKPLTVLSQRGASGIDGLVSGACGAARAAGVPTALLVGDVSFLHDLSGLATALHVETPLAILVVQNRGGRIFERLPVASYLAEEKGAMEHWTTPHEADLASAANVHGLRYHQVSAPQELRKALDQALETNGVTVIEAIVPEHGAADLDRRVAEHFREKRLREKRLRQEF